MSWNPLNLKKQATQHSDVSQNVAGEYKVEELIQRLNNLLDVSKSLFKDGKKYTEHVHEMSKSENKLTEDLSLSPVCHLNDDLRIIMEEYHSVSEQSLNECDDLILILQKALVEPMKKYNQMVLGVQANIRKREQAIQECLKYQTKVDKLQGKDKTGPIVAKLCASKKSLDAAKKEVANLDALLMVELPHILNARFDYFQPCLEAVIQAEVIYCGKFTTLLKDVVNSPLASSKAEKSFEPNIQQQLSEIRALSIVADD